MKTLLPPEKIPGLIGWFDCSRVDKITDSAGAVSAFQDISPSNFSVDQGTAARQPTTNATSFAGKNVITFDGGDVLAKASDPLSSHFSQFDTDITWFIVTCRTNATNSKYTHTVTDFSSAAAWAGNRGTTTQLLALFRAGDPTDFLTPSSSFSNNVLDSYTVAKSGTTADYYVDNTKEVTGGDFDGGSAGATNFDRFTIGATQSSSSESPVGGWESPIAEIIYYNRTLSETEIGIVNTYLGNKWGVPA